jgi:hypothetical protein
MTNLRGFIGLIVLPGLMVFSWTTGPAAAQDDQLERPSEEKLKEMRKQGPKNFPETLQVEEAPLERPHDKLQKEGEPVSPQAVREYLDEQDKKELVGQGKISEKDFDEYKKKLHDLEETMEDQVSILEQQRDAEVQPLEEKIRKQAHGAKGEQGGSAPGQEQVAAIQTKYDQQIQAVRQSYSQQIKDLKKEFMIE